jgi:CMP-N,N'-diacetyllegionaminic acid synthase
MRILGLIPARGGSKGVPKKNIKLLGKKPLIEYTIDGAKNSKLISQIVISTDDQEIAIAAEIAGCKPPFIRPYEIAQDNSCYNPQPLFEKKVLLIKLLKNLLLLKRIV